MVAEFELIPAGQKSKFRDVEAQRPKRKSNRLPKVLKWLGVSSSIVLVVLVLLVVLYATLLWTTPRYPVCQADVIPAICSDKRNRDAGYTCADEKQRFIFQCEDEKRLRLLGCIEEVGTIHLNETIIFAKDEAYVNSIDDDFFCDKDELTLAFYLN